jgi:hypothetical protein
MKWKEYGSEHRQGLTTEVFDALACGACARKEASRDHRLLRLREVTIEQKGQCYA